MIDQLHEFYNDSGELVVCYHPRQEELYRQATREFWEVATSGSLKHHSPELHRVRDEMQRKYHMSGLLLDLFLLPKGIQKHGGNFSAMVLKHFLQAQGFHVLVSEEDFYLMSERGHHYTNDGFRIIREIFGAKKIDELMQFTPQGGDPDVFAFLDHNPAMAWFIEAKRLREPLTKKQIQNFPHITNILCPVEIARIQPLPQKNQQVKTMAIKRHSAPLVNDNNLIALKDQKGAAVHIVFSDKKSGKLRICRHSMLDTTHGCQAREWEIVGRVTNANYYVEGVARLHRKYCRACLGHLSIQTNQG